MSSPEKIGNIIQSFLSEKGYLASCKENEVINVWSEIVGESIAEVSTCIKVENGTLFVEVKSSAWRQELSYLKKEILKKIQSCTECKTISNIVFL
jgi:predicted nucleic acid-binding Zn ribbon protein